MKQNTIFHDKDKKLKMKNITSPYPLLFPSEKVFLDENKIIFTKGKKSKEIYYRNIVKVDVEPLLVNWDLFALLYHKVKGLNWLGFLKLNDLVLTTDMGESIKFYNLCISGAEELIDKTKSVNPSLVVNKTDSSIFNTNISRGFVRVRTTFVRIPAFAAFLIIVIISIAVIIFIMYIANQQMMET